MNNVLTGILKPLQKTTEAITGLLKVNGKGVLSSKRTISAIIVAYCIADANSNGITTANTIWLAIGIIPACLGIADNWISKTLDQDANAGEN